jgi:sugar phosphate isomerase/epimerase
VSENVDLMCLFWTTAGVFPGEAGVSRFDFLDRVKEASRAGFTGIGIWHSDLENILSRLSLHEVRTILADHGMRYLELEFLTDWFVEGERRRASDRRRQLLLEASQALGAKHIKIGDFDDTQRPLSQIADAFAGLCAEARAYGATIGFEIMPSSMLKGLSESLAMVRRADAPNGGLILDLCHMTSLGIGLDEVCGVPLVHLINVELDDATLPGSPRHNPERARRYCGEGELDIHGFISAVRDTGYTGPWAVEVFSKELTALPLDELSTRAYETTIAQFHTP